MAKKGKLSRRSFLTRVAGTAIATGAAASVTGGAIAQNYTGRTDSDTGSYADRGGYGRTGAAAVCCPTLMPFAAAGCCPAKGAAQQRNAALRASSSTKPPKPGRKGASNNLAREAKGYSGPLTATHA